MQAFICNYNKHVSFVCLLRWMQSLPSITKITVVDNGSDYAPLLSFYDSLVNSSVTVIRKETGDHLSPAHEIRTVVGNDSFVYTDADLIPYLNTPVDIIEKCQQVLDSDFRLVKVGPGLAIHDLPRSSPFTSSIQHSEQLLLKQPLCNNLARKAYIDTTFAVYRSMSSFGVIGPAARLNAPYLLKHVDWYEDPDNPTDEYRHYLKTAKSCATFAELVRGYRRQKGLEI